MPTCRNARQDQTLRAFHDVDTGQGIGHQLQAGIKVCVALARVKKCPRRETGNSVPQHVSDRGFVHETCRNEQSDGLELFLATTERPPFVTAGPFGRKPIRIHDVAPVRQLSPCGIPKAIPSRAGESLRKTPRRRFQPTIRYCSCRKGRAVFRPARPQGTRRSGG